MEKLTIGDRYKNKRISLSINDMKCISKITCLEEKLLAVKFLYKSFEVHTSASAYIIAVYLVSTYHSSMVSKKYVHENV